MKCAPLEELHRPRNTTYEQVYNRALEVFGFDRDKLNAWWLSKHEQFGNLAPYEMVKKGKGRKLIKLLGKCQ